MRKNFLSIILISMLFMWAGILFAQESWQVQYAHQGGEHSLATDAGGIPHIAFEIDSGAPNQPSEIYYGSLKEQGWDVEKVAGLRIADAGLQLRMDSGNTPHIAYSTEWGSSIFYAVKPINEWQSEKVRDQWTQNDVSLAIDGLNKPHVICGDNGTKRLMHYSKDGSTWEAEIIADDFSGYTTVAVDADSNNGLHVIFYANGFTYHAYKSGEVWVTEELTGCFFIPSRQGMVIDSADNIHAAGTYSGIIVYCKKDGAGWHFEEIPLTPTYGNSQASICLDSQGYPHITFIDYYSKKVMYCYKDGSGWHINSVFSNTNSNQTLVNNYNYANHPPYIAIDSSGRPRVTFNISLYGNTADMFIMYAFPETGLNFQNPPQNPAITAEAKFQYTNQKLVDIFLSADGAKEMIISEDENFTAAEWEPYSPFKPFELDSEARGIKTLYAKFRGDDPSRETAVVSYSFPYAKYPYAIIDTVSPNLALESESVTFSGHGVDDRGYSITDYEWKILDSRGILFASSNEFSPSVSNLNMGFYRADFRVKNDHGEWSDPETESILSWDRRVYPKDTDAAYEHLYERMDLYQSGATPRLIESYAEPYPIYTIKNAFIYDDALVVGAFLARGESEDIRRAKLISWKFIELNQRDGIIRDSYNAETYGITRGTASTGNLAWVTIALMQYYFNSGDTDTTFLNTVLQNAKSIGEYIETNCRDVNYYGYEGSSSITWKSTEHNTDCYAAFMLLYRATAENKWFERASWARKFLTEVAWFDSDEMFWVGTDYDGRSLNKYWPQQAEDANSWPILALGAEKYGKSLRWVELNCGTGYPSEPPYQFIGFDFNTDKDGVWFEGTAHMALAYQVAKETEKSDLFINQLRKAQKQAPNNNGKGITATPNDALSTGHGFYYYPSLHIAPTAWYLAAEEKYNLFWGTGTDRPVPRYYPLPYATIQEGIDNAQSGDTIYINPAAYTENITLKEGVSLVGVGGEPVIVNGKITMANNSSIENMTFDYEIPNTAPHVMLNITASNVTVKDCNFRLYQNQPRRGLKTDNLANISGDNITLEGNDFYFESSSSRFMKGIYANSCSNLTLRGNRIHLKGDTAQLSYYLNGVSLVSADNPTFENNIIHLESNNAWALNGLMLSACDNALVKNNTIYIKSTRPYVSQFNGISANQVPHANIRNNIINFETDLQNSYYNYYPYSTYLKPCNIIGNTLTGDTNISLTYNIYNAGYAFLSKSPATLAVTDDNNIKGEEDSIAIDRGDPNDDYSKEPEPNGGRINSGSYGNTQEATTTPAHIAARVIFATALEGGSITPKGSILVTDGGSQAFTITPSYYYSIFDVLLDDVPELVTGNTYTLDNVTADHTIKARFTPKPTVTITAQGGNGGYISPSGSVKVVMGDSRAFYLRPYTDQHIKDIMVDGSSIGPKASYTFNNVNANHTIQVVFEEGRAIIALAGEGGEIDPGGEIRIEQDEYGKYEHYIFQIRPYEGYRIKDVLVDGSPVGSVTSYEFTEDLSLSHIIEAVFVKEVYELSVDTEGSGSVSITPKRHEYEYGAYVSLKAVPSEGHYFSRWTGDTGNISGIYNASTYIIMRDNASIAAAFASYGDDAD